MLIAEDIGQLYLALLRELRYTGDEVRIGRLNVMTREVLAQTIILTDVRKNILEHPVRNLNYRFMLAEWLWIMAGRDDLATLTRYNHRMAEFSDDGRTLAGAYGPRLRPQWGYILETLKNDPSSRQAVATIWTPVPRRSKDIPCTVACQFLVRNGYLTGIFTMRSSDAWLGIPHDVYTFANIINAVATGVGASSGNLILNLGSAHLYEENLSKVDDVLERAEEMAYHRTPALPASLLIGDTAERILAPSAPPGMPASSFATYHRAIHAPSSKECLAILREGRA